MFAFVYAKNIIRPLPLYILRIKKKRPFFSSRKGREGEKSHWSWAVWEVLRVDKRRAFQVAGAKV